MIQKIRPINPFGKHGAGNKTKMQKGVDMTSTDSKTNFPFWMIPVALGILIAVLIATVTFGKTMGLIGALYVIFAGHVVSATCLGFFVTLFYKETKALAGAVGGIVAFVLMAIFSVIAEFSFGFYDPIFEIFDWIGGVGRVASFLALICLLGGFVAIGFTVGFSKLFKALNWSRLGKAIAAQPGIDMTKESKPLSKREQAEARRKQ